MADGKSEKNTSLWVGLLVLVLSIVYILVSLGKSDWVKIISIIWGFFLTGFLFFQAGVTDYFRKKDYRKIGFGDIVVWLTVGVAFMTLVNTFMMISSVGKMLPEWLTSFAKATGIFVGVTGGVLAIVHMLMPRFK